MHIKALEIKRFSHSSLLDTHTKLLCLGDTHCGSSFHLPAKCYETEFGCFSLLFQHSGSAFPHALPQPLQQQTQPQTHKQVELLLQTSGMLQ